MVVQAKLFALLVAKNAPVNAMIGWYSEVCHY